MDAIMESFRSALRDLEAACAELIPRDTEDVGLRDARCLITSALMRSTSVQRLLSEFAFSPCGVDVAECIWVRSRVQVAFGAPGDWEGKIGTALRALYAVHVLDLVTAQEPAEKSMT